jgi:hypothetical protein
MRLRVQLVIQRVIPSPFYGRSAFSPRSLDVTLRAKPISNLPYLLRCKARPFAMASVPASGGEANGLDISVSDMSIQEFQDCYPQYNPFDVYRAKLAIILSNISGVDAKTVYPALQWTQTLDNGDLVLPVPALKIKGRKPTDLAAEWAEKVRYPLPGNGSKNVPWSDSLLMRFCYLVSKLSPVR